MPKRKLYPASISQEYTKRIDSIASLKANILSKYKSINAILSEILDLITANLPYVMSGKYAKVEYVCELLDKKGGSAVRRLRLHCRYRDREKANLEKSLEGDLATLRLLANLLSSEANVVDRSPDEHSVKPASSVVELSNSKSPWVVVRTSVTDCRSLDAVEVVNMETEESLMVDLKEYSYLAPMLRKGTRINLVYFATKQGSCLSFVVYEPDYLVDVTSISSCYAPYAITPKLFFIRRLSPNESTKYILLGNLSGQFLDESLTDLRAGRTPHLDYAASAKRFFRTNALDLATVQGIDSAWHKEAQQQQRNVAEALAALQNSDPNFNPQLASTEASMICADLGLRGRADLMQSDWNFLIEQKSGKMETFHVTGPKEDHYIQMMLYKTMLSLRGEGGNSHASQYFLYSKYAPSQGLIREGSSLSPAQAKTAMQIRNSIVYSMFKFVNPVELRAELTSWTPNSFRLRQVSDNLWNPYSLPELNKVLRPIHTVDQLTQAYFFEMLSFVIREDLVARVGSTSRGKDGFANLWNTGCEDRVASGEMIMGLRFVSMMRDALDDGPDECSVVVMEKTVEADAVGMSEPNFRIGDPVNLYDYALDGTPNILKTITHRATLIRIDENASVGCPSKTKTYTIKLRSPQTKAFFAGDSNYWAIEHDQIESSTTRLFSQLTNLLRTTIERRSLLTSQRSPSVDSTKQQRIGDYGVMNDLVDRSLAARELFLLVGPPGTGKTSVGLMNILHEELAHEGHSILLLSYTNRAVDEICSKLEKDGLDYVRIGSRFSCAEQYRSKLMIEVEFCNVESVRRKIMDTRIIIGTTMSISGSAGLFKLKKFNLAIVDEASQILEPSIIGILSEANTYGLFIEPSIERFVLIGDQKQLPAVVQQNRTQTVVTDERLRKIGLLDCRDSFFERMIRLYGDDDSLVYRLTKHGRMHPEVADFCNTHFYGGTLTPIPLSHQVVCLDLHPESQESDDLTNLLSTRRTAYFDSHSDDSQMTADQDKVNAHEADMIADMAIRILKIYNRAGKSLRADSTIGIVVPYRNQITAIRSRLVSSESLPEEFRDIARNLTIDTVERFQGSEREVIIYGLTVTRASQLEFLRDSQFSDVDGSTIDRKLNVALTRAREQLFVVGDKQIMKTEPLFAELIQAMNK